MGENNQNRTLINTDCLKELLIGPPQRIIYAFKVVGNKFGDKVKNALKVGDTKKTVTRRIEQWKKIYGDSSVVYQNHWDAVFENKDKERVYFRDYSVHNYFKNKLEKNNLDEKFFGDNYYSKEFYEVKEQDVIDAIKDIKSKVDDPNSPYDYYKASASKKEEWEDIPEDKKKFFEPRENQLEVVRSFEKAVKAGKNNLLLYAVMRFGKTFTSLLCANKYKEINENKPLLVLVVSGKADVASEWRKNVMMPKNFSNFEFFDNDSLLELEKADSKIDKIVFLTLQNIKDEKSRFNYLYEHDIDLMIIDETHFGARAPKLGKMLYNESVKEDDDNEEESLDDLDEELTNKNFQADVKIHLSGTPYRILMGNEFDEESIICKIQYSDIVKAKDEYDEEHSMDDDYNDWDNPYFGFPQMLRFAFHPNKSTKKLLSDLKKDGGKYSFSALFETKQEKNGYSFVHENEVLELFEAIDGTKEDSEILPFLKLQEIKDAELCKHMILALPFKASCDALFDLIKKKSKELSALNEYELINVSGTKSTLTPEEVKNWITKYDNEGKKTITLTVNKMLTGSTVPEWDTMIYLKDTASPQDYDQAIYRLQSQHIRECKNSKGEIEKENLKPQTLLVDFDPYRVFSLFEEEALYGNIAENKKGKDSLKEKINENLNISPIITVNVDKLERVECQGFMDKIINYSHEKGIIDEVSDIKVDLNLMTDNTIIQEIGRQVDIASNKGFTTDAYGDDDDDEGGSKLSAPGKQPNADEPGTKSNKKSKNDKKDEITEFIHKFRTYYSRILFYSYLVNDKVESLDDVIESVNNSPDNQRIMKNLGIKINILEQIKKLINPYILIDLEKSISRINMLANDTTISIDDRIDFLFKKFKKISSSEIITPRNICDEMIKETKIELKDDTKILELGTEIGEYALALIKEFGLEKVKNKVYALPTSRVAYEFTKKTYRMLGFDEKYVLDFSASELIKDGAIDDEEMMKRFSNYFGKINESDK